MHADKTPISSSARPRTRSQVEKLLLEKLKSKPKKGASSGNHLIEVGSESLGKRKRCLKQDVDLEIENSGDGDEDVRKFEGRMTRSMRRANGGQENCSGSRAVVSERKSKGNVGSGRAKKLVSSVSKGKDQDNDVVLLEVKYISPGGGSTKGGGLRSGSVSGKFEGRMTRSMRRAGNGGEEDFSGSRVVVSEGKSEENGSKANDVLVGLEYFSPGGSSTKGGDLRLGSVSGNGDGSGNLEEDDCIHLGLCSSSASDGSDHSIDDKNVESDGDIGMAAEEEKVVDSDMKTDLETRHCSDDDNDSVEDLDLSSLKVEKDFGRGSESKAGNENDNPWCDLDYVVKNTSDSDNSAREEDESEESTDLDALLGEESSCDDDSDDFDYKGEESLSSDDSGTTEYVSDNDGDVDYDSNGDGTSDIQGSKKHGFEQIKDDGNDEGYNNENERSHCHQEKERAVINTDDREKSSSNTERQSTVTKKSRGAVQRTDDVMDMTRNDLPEGKNRKEEPCYELQEDEGYNENERSHCHQEKERAVINIDDSEKSSSNTERQSTVTKKASGAVQQINDAMEEAKKVLFQCDPNRVGSGNIGDLTRNDMPEEKNRKEELCFELRKDEGYNENQAGNSPQEKEQSVSKIDDSKKLSSHKKSPRIYTEKGGAVLKELDEVMDEAWKVLGDDSNRSGSKRPIINTEKERHNVQDIDEIMDEVDKVLGNGSNRSGSKRPRMDEASKVLGSGDGSSRSGTDSKKRLCGLGIQVEFGENDQRRFGRNVQPHPSNQFKESGFGKVSPSPIKNINTQYKWRADGVGKKRFQVARKDELMRMLVKSIDSMDDPVKESAPVQEPLPVKFRFDDGVDPPQEKSEQEKEMESLYLDMQLALCASEIDDYANSSKTANEDPMPAEIDKSPAACCRRGEHDTIRDEQIGILCRHCGTIVVDIKHILPDWDMRRFRRQNRKDFGDPPDSIGDDLKFDYTSGTPGSFTRAKGTVWDLVPGVEEVMFPHQREAFEFMWKNIAGDIRLDKLESTLCNNGKGTGCIISHAPGTGKTRLTLVFLEAFLKLYPTCCPMIIAPTGVLNVWKTEIEKWDSNLVFHNLNDPELSSNEIQTVKQKAGLVGIGKMNKADARLVKLYSWIISGGILGISYKLFSNLAGTSKGKGKPKTETEVLIWNKLAQKPDLVVLDEGHVPRNGGSCIFKALRKVETQRRIILSGTPFQNNFDELKNTLCLVDPKFLVLDKNDWKQVTTEGTDNLKKLRSMLDPLIHVHNGSLLQKDLPGLRYTIVSLRPSALQGTILKIAEDMNVKFVKKTHLLTLISVHPSMVLPENNLLFSSYKSRLEEIESDPDAGVKLKFVMNLTYLATEHGERVLIFSQYLPPLLFIKSHLEARHSWKEGREILYLDGQLDEKHRQESISSLNDASSKAKVLLASVRACSEGINMIGASRLVLLDTVWNPSVEKQAICRAYRYLQSRVVYVYRLIISGLEVRQCKMQAQKQQISQRILDDGQTSEADASISNEILEDKVLDATVNLESCRDIFEKIIHQSKASDFWLEELEAANSPGS